MKRTTEVCFASSEVDLESRVRRVWAVLAYEFPTLTLEGRSTRWSGAGRAGLRARRWIRPIALPQNPGVDRGLCGEFQALSALADEVFIAIERSRMRREDVEGEVRLAVKAPPCLSCVCAIRQFHVLFPRVSLAVAWGEAVDGCEPQVGAHGMTYGSKSRDAEYKKK